MSSSKMTLIGLYNYLKMENKDLFESLVLPSGIDKDTLCANILQRGSEFEVMYPDPDYIRASIGVWAKKWYWTIDKWIKLINTEYSPLENYDRYENWTDNNTHKDDDTISSKRDITGTQNSQSTSAMTTNTQDNAEVEHTKSAYDSGDYSPYEKTTTSDNVSENSNVNAESSTGSTNNDKYNESRGNKGEYQNIHNGRMHGNIGVMSSQDMFLQEIDVAYFNLYDRITDMFLVEYTIPVYI